MKVLFLVICSLLTAAVFAADNNAAKKLEQLEQERLQVRAELIRQRAKEIKNSERLQKLVKEIRELNQELTTHLDSKPEVRELNKKMRQIEQEILKIRKSQKKEQK